MRKRKQAKTKMKDNKKHNDKKSQKYYHGQEENTREEMLRLNEALQHLTRKKDKSEKGWFIFVQYTHKSWT